MALLASLLLALPLLLSSLLATAQPGSDIDQYLRAHNDFRELHGAMPLAWSMTLANAAQTWVDRCQYRHSFGAVGNYGENLAVGTGDYTIEDAIQSWTDQSSQYDPGDPQGSGFTQVVWKNTREVGCAVKECWGFFPPRLGPARFYACEYSPPGNRDGEYPYVLSSSTAFAGASRS
uniref:Repressed by TUP1 protein 4 n=1 Tax=Ganoderma boninense TaxID=34458 RepID=A0A5K1JYL6_9APHY|nr:Repressed by TUP1 protein 4 [Ganoderma boninense]